MNDKVINIEDLKPHLTISTDNGEHVVPLSLVDKWANGESEPDKDCLKTIINEWIYIVTGSYLNDD